MKENKIRFSIRLKSVIIIITMSIILCSIAVVMSYLRFSDTNEANFKDHANDMAHIATNAINGDDLKVVHDATIKTFRSIPEDKIVLSEDWGSEGYEEYMEHFKWIEELPEYKSVYATLERLQDIDSETFSSIYIAAYDTSRSMEYALYLVDASEEDACPVGLTEHSDEADYSIAYDPEAGEPYVTNMDIYGWLVTANASVYDSSGECVGYVGVDLSMDDIKAVESRFVLILAILLVALTAVLCVIVLLLINRSIIRPIKKLSLVATDYMNETENREKFESVDLHRSDEIGMLSDAMKKMETDIDRYILDITTITAERERMNAELNVAAKMQADMLPKDFCINDRLALYASMTPAREIGGDFYDFFMIDDDRVGIVMADVSGKGMPAAMFMVIARTLLKIRASSEGTPAQMLFDVNNTLCEDNPSNLFVTVWLGILTLTSGELIFANAGHEYPAIRTAGGDYTIDKKENMPPLAAMEDIEYTDETVRLSPGDRVFLYTDGVPEAKRDDGARFGEERMLEMLQRDKDCTPDELLMNMKKEIDAFAGDMEPFDDITMMDIIYKG